MDNKWQELYDAAKQVLKPRDISKIIEAGGVSAAIYNDPLAYAELILNGNPKEYLKNAARSHGLED